MLARLAKLASITGALRKDLLEKKAVMGVLGSIAAGATMFAAKNPVKTLTGVAAVSGSKSKYKENVGKFRESAGVPLPPGVG